VVNEYIFEGSKQAIFRQASFLKTAQQNDDLQPENKDRQRTMGLCVNLSNFWAAAYFHSAHGCLKVWNLPQTAIRECH